MSSENDLQLQPLTDPGRAQLRWEVTTVGCLYVGYAGLILCRTAVPIAAPAMIADPTLGLDEQSFGALLGWGAGGALAGKLLCGVAADHFGGRRLFLFAMASMAVTTLAFGLSSTHALFMLFNFAAQLTKAAGWPAMAKIIGAWFEAGRLGRIWGIISTSSRASSVLSSLLLGALLTFLPWRWLFVVAATITLCVLVVCFFALQDSPMAVGLKTPPKLDANADDAPPSAWAESVSSTLAFFAGNNRVRLICISIVALTLQMEFLSFLPLYMVDVHGLDR